MCVVHILTAREQSHTGRRRMHQAKTRIHSLSATTPDRPTVGAIKRALHELSQTSGSEQGDRSTGLREANDHLRQLALRSGIDPDVALKRSLAAVALLRERMAVARDA